MNFSCKTVVVSKAISSDLALRYNATLFFRHLDSLPENLIVLDFRNVKSITRSFAQEYSSRRQKSRKIIREINVPRNVEKMFNVVETVSSKMELLDLEKRKPIMLEM